MTGSFLAPIIIPIVAFITLACWLAMVYWADAHPGWKKSSAAPGPEITGASGPGTGTEQADRQGSEPALPPRHKAAA